MTDNWLGLSRPDIRHELQTRFDVRDEELDDAVNEVIELHESLHSPFRRFWDGDPSDPEITVEGWSYARLLKRPHLGPIGAWLHLNWLRKRPKEALEYLNLRTERVEF